MRMAKTRAAANKQQDEDDEQDTVVSAPKPKQQAASAEADPSDIAAANSEKMPAGNRSDNGEKAAPKSAYDPSKVRGDDDDDPPSRSAKVAGDPGVITVPDKVFALSPDGGMAAFSADGGESIQVYDTYTESLVKSVTKSFLKPTTLKFSEDGKRLLVGGRDGHLKTISIGNREQLDFYRIADERKAANQEPLKAHDSTLLSITVDETNGIIATADTEGVINLWTDSDNQSYSFQTSQSNSVQKLVLADDGDSLFGLQQRELRHWILSEPGAKGAFDGVSWSNSAVSMEVNSDLSLITIGLETGDIVFFEVGSEGELKRGQFTGFEDAVVSLGIDELTQQLIGVSESGKLERWGLPLDRDLNISLTDPTPSAIISPDAKMLGVESDKKNVDLYSLVNGKPIRRHTIPSGSLTASDFNHDGTVIAMGSSDGKIYFQSDDRATFAYLNTPFTPVSSIQRIPGEDKLFSFWSAEQGIGAINFARQEDIPTSIIADELFASSNGNTIAVRSGDYLHVLNTVTQSVIKSIQIENLIPTAGFSTEDALYVGTKDGEIASWNYQNDRLEIMKSEQDPFGTAVKSIHPLELANNILMIALSSGDLAAVKVGENDTYEVVAQTKLASKPNTLLSQQNLALGVLESSLELSTAAKADQKIVFQSETVNFPYSRLQGLQFHLETKQFAGFDDNGNLTYGEIGKDSIQSIQPPIDSVRSLLWSNDGRHLVLCNERRLAVFDPMEQRVDAEFMMKDQIGKLVSFLDGQLWLTNENKNILSLSIPQIRWIHSQDPNSEDPPIASVATSSSNVGVLTMNGSLKVWNARTGDLTFEQKVDAKNTRSLISFPKSSGFAFLSSISDITRLDGDGSMKTTTSMSAFRLEEICVIPESDQVIARSQTNRLLSLNLENSERTEEILSISPDSFFKVTDDKKLIIASKSKPIALIKNLQTLVEQQSTSKLPPGTSGLFARDSKSYYQKDNDKTLSKFSLNSAKLESESPIANVNHFELCNDLIAVTTENDSGETSELQIYEPGSSELKNQKTLPSKDRGIAISNDGRLIAVPLENGSIVALDSTTLELTETLHHDSTVISMTFMPNNNGLFISDETGEVKSLPFTSGGSIKTGESGVVGIETVRHLGDNLVIACSRDGSIQVWNQNEPDAVHCTLKGAEGAIKACFLSTDKEHFIVSYENTSRSICIWETNLLNKTQTPIEATQTIQASSLVLAADTYKGGKYLFAGLLKGGVVAWRLSDGQQVASIGGHRTSVESLSITQDNFLVSFGEDMRILAIDISTLGIENQVSVRRTSLKPVFEPLQQQELKPELSTEPITQQEARAALNRNEPELAVIEQLKAPKETIDAAIAAASALKAALNSNKNDKATISQVRRKLAKLKPVFSTELGINQVQETSGNRFTNQLFESQTDYSFEQDDMLRSIVIKIDGNRLYAGQPSKQTPQNRKPNTPAEAKQFAGRLQIWDHALSGLKLRDWTLEPFQLSTIIPKNPSAGVVTAPTGMSFLSNGSAVGNQIASAWAVDKASQRYAHGLGSGYRKESDILQVFSLNGHNEHSSETPIWVHRGYDQVVTAVAFANQTNHVAFATRGPKNHQIFIADLSTGALHKVEDFEHATEWNQPQPVTNRTQQANRFTNKPPNLGQYDSRIDDSQKNLIGVDTLVFSPDDKILVSHGEYEKSKYKLSRWNITWDSNSKVKESRKSIKELTDEKSPVVQNSMGKGIWFIESPTETVDDTDNLSIHRGTQYRILALRPESFSIINMNSAREEETIRFPSTARSIPVHDVTRDGRWLISGDSSGQVYIWDLLKRSKYSITIDAETERILKSEDTLLEPSQDRPAHTGPIAGVALSQPDPGKDYPALAATVGEENKIKVWELYPILDSKAGKRSKPAARYPISTQ